MCVLSFLVTRTCTDTLYLTLSLSLSLCLSFPLHFSHSLSPYLPFSLSSSIYSCVPPPFPPSLSVPPPLSYPQAGEWDFTYGVQYAWHLVIFTMVVTFSVTTPLITPFGEPYKLETNTVILAVHNVTPIYMEICMCVYSTLMKGGERNPRNPIQ